MVVNHIDSDRLNNRVENLEIVTLSENAQHAIAAGFGNQKAVRQLSLKGEIIAEYSSIRNATRATDIHEKGIGSCVNKIQNTAGGFKWEAV